MKKLIYIVFGMFLFSCKSSQKMEVSNMQVSTSEEEFVLAYKSCVMYGCINEATNNKFYLFSKENNDLGLAVEVEIMQHYEVSVAKNKGKELSKEIKAIDYADFEGRKPIFTDCLRFAFSKEVDSLAREMYKKKVKN